MKTSYWDSVLLLLHSGHRCTADIVRMILCSVVCAWRCCVDSRISSSSTLLIYRLRIISTVVVAWQRCLTFRPVWRSEGWLLFLVLCFDTKWAIPRVVVNQRYYVDRRIDAMWVRLRNIPQEEWWWLSWKGQVLSHRGSRNAKCYTTSPVHGVTLGYLPPGCTYWQEERLVILYRGATPDQVHRYVTVNLHDIRCLLMVLNPRCRRHLMTTLFPAFLCYAYDSEAIVTFGSDTQTPLHNCHTQLVMFF